MDALSLETSRNIAKNERMKKNTLKNIIKSKIKKRSHFKINGTILITKNAKANVKE